MTSGERSNNIQKSSNTRTRRIKTQISSNDPPPGYPLPPNATQHPTQILYPPPPPYPYPYPYPAYPPPTPYPAPPYQRPTIYKRMSELPLLLIFLVCLTVFWFSYIFGQMMGAPLLLINPNAAEIVGGAFICVFAILLTLFIRQWLDRPTWKDYGLSTENLGSNIILAIKLIFIIYAVEFLIFTIIEDFGVSFKGGPEVIDIYFIISAVIIAPIFEETVYRMNASTLLARRLPILWVAGIVSTWFIAKHIFMWHFDDNFGLPAILIIIAVEIPIWMVITYYFLKRNCIWIPVMVHVFNNGSIVLFHYLPPIAGFILDRLILLIGIIFIFVFAIPKFNLLVIEKLKAGRIKFTEKTIYYLGIAIGLSILFLLTSEALVYLMYFEYGGIPVGVILCSAIGLMLILLSIITIVYIFTNRNTVYVEDQPQPTRSKN